MIQIGQLILTLIWEITGLNEDTMSGLMLFVLGCGIILVIIELALIIYDMKVERDDRIKKDNIAWNNHLKKEKKLEISYLLGSECTDTRSDKKCWLEDQRKQKMMEEKIEKENFENYVKDQEQNTSVENNIVETPTNRSFVLIIYEEMVSCIISILNIKKERTKRKKYWNDYDKSVNTVGDME